ncbi:MAG: hypothetical protein H0X62_02195 [Bacteroidetes bacterium]|nr:hypothetical protein [Bacteroidota bacterium]
MKKFLEESKPYKFYWNEWLNSHKCFLRPNERELGKLLFVYDNIESIAKVLNINRSTTIKNYSSLVFHLSYFKEKFFNWVEEYSRIMDGTEKAPGETKKFLTADLAYHDISIILYLRLTTTRLHNIGDILIHFSLDQLTNIRGFGKVSENEFIKLLMENDCLELLERKQLNNINYNTKSTIINILSV